MAMSPAETAVATETCLSSQAAEMYWLTGARFIALAAHYQEHQAG
jgi:hypothetical protein